MQIFKQQNTAKMHFFRLFLMESLCQRSFVSLLAIHIHTKKRDHNVAVPLTEALVLPLVPNSNTKAHANMYICTH